MKARLFQLTVLMLVPLLMLGAACSEDSSGDGPVTEEERRSFLDSVEARLQDIQDEIAGLRQRVANGDLAREIDTRLDDLESEREKLQGELDELRNATDEEWRRVRDRVSDSLDNLRDRLEGL